jgi:hypothetical protein
MFPAYFSFVFEVLLAYPSGSALQVEEHAGIVPGSGLVKEGIGDLR